MTGFRVIGTERLKGKRKWNTVYVGGIKETAKQGFEEIKKLVESDIKGMNVCEVHAFFVAGNAFWKDGNRTVDYSVRAVDEYGRYSNFVVMDI